MSTPQCPICLETFTRQEHVDRHVRSHTNEKPFKCPLCQKAFSRRDLLARHEKGHTPALNGDGSATKSASVRVQAACTSCASSKQKCTGEKPCSRCTQKNITCTFPENHGVRRKLSRIAQAPVASSGGVRHESVFYSQTSPSEEQSPASPAFYSNERQAVATEPQAYTSAIMPAPPTSFNNMSLSQTPLPSTGYPVSHTQPVPINYRTPSYVSEGNMYNNGMLGLNDTGEDLDMGIWSQSMAEDLNAFLTNLYNDGSNMGLVTNTMPTRSLTPSSPSIQAQYYQASANPPLPMESSQSRSRSVGSSTNIPSPGVYEMEHTFGLPGPYAQSLRTSLPPIRDALSASARMSERRDHLEQGLKTEAATPFTTSTLLWTPTAEDTNLDINSLAPMNTHMMSLQLPRTRPTFHPRIVVMPRMTSATREQIIMVLTKAQLKGPWAEMDLAFPDLGFLQDMLDNYFQYTHPQYPMVHMGTFDPNIANYMLTGAMLAVGTIFSMGLPRSYGNDLAARTAVAAPRQAVGFGMLESARRALANSFECDNTNVRNIEVLQASLIVYIAGGFSGRPRPSEVSEAFANNLVTMVRRSDWFRPYTYPSLRSSVYEHEDLSADARWKAWIRNEERKRLVLTVLVWTTQMGANYQTRALISHSELGLPLLHSDQLWNSQDANSWYSIARQEAKGNQEETAFNAFSGRFISFDPAEIITSPASSKSFLLRMALVSIARGVVFDHRQMVNAFEMAAPQPSLVCLNRRKRKRQGHAEPTGMRMLSLGQRHTDLQDLLDTCEGVLQDEEHDPKKNQEENTFLQIWLHKVAIELNSSLLDLLKLAGRENVNEAKKALPSLLRWVDGGDSKRTIWHAGQIVRLSRKTILQNRVVHPLSHWLGEASLAIWAYGILEATSTAGGESPGSDTSPCTIYLDQQWTEDVSDFIKTGHGVPVLTNAQDQGGITLDRCQDLVDACEPVMLGLDIGGNSVPKYVMLGKMLGISGMNLIRSYRALPKR